MGNIQPSTATGQSPSQNGLCRWLGNPGGSSSSITANCAYGVRGRYVSVQRILGGVSGTLTLCEVQVFGSAATSSAMPPAPPPPIDGLPNIALNKRTLSSGAANGSSLFGPSKAVDGFTSVSAETYPHCFVSSNASPGNPWWMVDLGSEHLIYGLNIIPRSEYEFRYQSSRLEVRVGNTEVTSRTPPTSANNTICRSFPDSLGSYTPFSISCTPLAIRGRYVSIERLNPRFNDAILGLCEVQVLGVPSSPRLPISPPWPAPSRSTLAGTVHVTNATFAIGSQHACAILPGGSVKCWGELVGMATLVLRVKVICVVADAQVSEVLCM